MSYEPSQIYKFGQQRQYKLKQLKNVTFDIIHDISENITLVQFLDTIGNVNHDVSVSGRWIYYSNYNKLLPLVKIYYILSVYPHMMI